MLYTDEVITPWGIPCPYLFFHLAFPFTERLSDLLLIAEKSLFAEAPASPLTNVHSCCASPPNSCLQINHR